MAKLSQITELKGVGPKLAEQLHKLQIRSLADLFFHLPFRYEDRSQITPIGALQPMRPAVIQGEVRGATVLFGKRRSLLVKLQDHSGVISLRFYHFSAAQKNQFSTGTTIRCYGEPRRGASGLELYHPEYTRLEEGLDLPLEPSLTPVYPATDGISQQRLRLLHEQALELLKADQVDLTDLLPAAWLQQWRLPTLKDALLFLHTPPRETNLALLESGQHPAQKRLILEELLAHQLSLHKLRAQVQADEAPAIHSDKTLQRALLQQLPFTPTGAQQRVVSEIEQDLTQPYPMLRLVQGDVGSGKTLVAALAACDLLQAGFQVALMAPTEILAEQHLNNLSGWFEPLGIRLGWLAGKVKGKARERSLAEIASGEAQLVVGTHALFQDDVHFARLGLIIIDEQHRFGVHQRLSLREKGVAQKLSPHQLIMTATPIPRTLAMSAYADLDTSVIDELPPGRSPITTVAIGEQRRPEVIERVNGACAEGAQAYWVCTLIEESEALQCQAAENTAQELAEALPHLRIGLVHGRMKAAEKADIMARFKAHELDLLVATTVIEVGVDVPNASLMIIENPERLGLAQLHQLRGRVGRGSAKSHCVLLYKAPLSFTSKQRLQVMRDSQDGFYIAEQDLQIRGPGELLGTRQTGLQMLRVADLQRDGDLLPQVRDMAQQLWTLHPHTVEPLIQRWLGDAERFANV
ncbi:MULTISPECIES: ATP-dependent DNA helicase RecG [Thalassolituus]|uniref:ATP-dependent DNA helicase RecG n=1 Tax=Thalassolituus TaxID=187492 RepID=UPI000C5E4DC2|nr:ATP-dependent DNA helicase RecG [Thalassolituus alkanivorans]MAY15451.1 ATP-dependent DNA helicase RecG [Oceanospirillaceae bacterium]MCA6058895.1 ATP-dependent DNA helicase RecG [Thalassolituus sp. ST750PaO-4]PIQ40163.1 MAG: ATP-dependent DNA helicase RecG [Thalassolituus sp. CG17_big_fil_post_rev_8_21_14_2_50_53_8]MCB2387758.1 ATP-dependent DNA helicase RecG [Thalassolituus alkanivorans]MCB2422542.1 ATP-dependent DNA helicase RecG [Thalassolituus alkanivorans]